MMCFVFSKMSGRFSAIHMSFGNEYMGLGYAPVIDATRISPISAASRSDCSVPRGSVYSMDSISGASLSSSSTNVSPKDVTPMAASPSACRDTPSSTEHTD